MFNSFRAFRPTHEVKGKMVEHRGGLLYVAEDGSRVWVGRGAKAVPLPEQDTQVAVIEPPPPPRPPKPPVPLAPKAKAGEIVLLHAETAAAILRAAGWPAWGESVGIAEAPNGSSVTLENREPDGSYRAKVSLNGEGEGGGGRHLVVRVTPQIAFELLEDE